MSLLEWANLGGTLLTFGCFSFAITSFGGKLGRVSGFTNTTGFQYISHSPNSDKLFEDIVKVNSTDEKAPSWVKDAKQLKNRCQSYQYSLKHWNDTVKYCLVQNTVRHQLIKSGLTLKDAQETGCTENLLNTYSDGTESFAFLLAKKECKKPDDPAPAQASPEVAASSPAPAAGSAPAATELGADGGGNGGGSSNGGGSNAGSSGSASTQ